MSKLTLVNYPWNDAFSGMIFFYSNWYYVVGFNNDGLNLSFVKDFYAVVEKWPKMAKTSPLMSIYNFFFQNWKKWKQKNM
jgi:hypothetical protein